MSLLRCLAAAALSISVACSFPTVKVETPKPIEVDINMRVDIYQHEDKTADPVAETAGAKNATAAENRRRERMAQIQTLKNSRLVGENREGLLSIRDLPPGEYGEYVKQTVDDENADRNILMESTAKKEQKPLAEVRRNVADLWRERSFPGEWIEVPGEAGTWSWVQKAAQDKTS